MASVSSVHGRCAGCCCVQPPALPVTRRGGTGPVGRPVPPPLPPAADDDLYEPTDEVSLLSSSQSLFSCLLIPVCRPTINLYVNEKVCLQKLMCLFVKLFYWYRCTNNIDFAQVFCNVRELLISNLCSYFKHRNKNTEKRISTPILRSNYCCYLLQNFYYSCPFWGLLTRAASVQIVSLLLPCASECWWLKETDGQTDVNIVMLTGAGCTGFKTCSENRQTAADWRPGNYI